MNRSVGSGCSCKKCAGQAAPETPNPPFTIGETLFGGLQAIVRGSEIILRRIFTKMDYIYGWAERTISFRWCVSLTLSISSLVVRSRLFATTNPTGATTKSCRLMWRRTPDSAPGQAAGCQRRRLAGGSLKLKALLAVARRDLVSPCVLRRALVGRAIRPGCCVCSL